MKPENLQKVISGSDAGLLANSLTFDELYFVPGREDFDGDAADDHFGNAAATSIEQQPHDDGQRGDLEPFPRLPTWRRSLVVFKGETLRIRIYKGSVIASMYGANLGSHFTFRAQPRQDKIISFPPLFNSA